MSTINFKVYAVRENNVVSVEATLEKFRTELLNYVNNLEPSTEEIQALVDQCLFEHRSEVVNADFVSGEVARSLSSKAANYSPLKRLVLSFISEHTKTEKNNNPNPRYKSGRGRGNTGLQLLPELYEQMELKQVLPAAAE
jgi:hypothetical protein